MDEVVLECAQVFEGGYYDETSREIIYISSLTLYGFLALSF